MTGERDGRVFPAALPAGHRTALHFSGTVQKRRSAAAHVLQSIKCAIHAAGRKLPSKSRHRPSPTPYTYVGMPGYLAGTA